MTVLTTMLHAIDDLRWDEVRHCLADRVSTDYTSLFGGEVQVRSAEELIAGWQALLPGFAATQHLTGPVVEAGNQLRTHVRAHHWPTEGAPWTVHGHYLARLDSSGRIAELTLRTFRQDGDPGLAEQATTNPDRRRPA